MNFLSILLILSIAIISVPISFSYQDERKNNDDNDIMDIVILNGRVIDPETMLDDIRNVGIRNGTIVSVTNETINGKEIINATGLVVSPGFIDTHWHGIDPFATKLGISDGVTTGMDLEVGVYDVEKFYKEREDKWKMNYGTTVGHLFARMVVLSDIILQDFTDASNAIGEAAIENEAAWSIKTPNEEEHIAILKILDKGLKEGAIGIGSALRYMSNGVDAREMFEVQKLAGKYDRLTDVHTRFALDPPPNEFVLGGHEIIANAFVLNSPVLFPHINNPGWDLAAEMLELSRDNGLTAWGEYYPYVAGLYFISTEFLSPERLEEEGKNASETVLDPTTGKFLSEEELKETRKIDPGRIIIAFLRPSEWIVEWIKSPGLTVASDSMLGLDKNGTLLKEDAPFEEYTGHPRTAGTHGKVLKMAKENNIPLMHVIKSMSYLPAKYLGDTGLDAMNDRGRIQEGRVADITIFNPETVTDNATYLDGENGLPTTGIPYVIVNGEFVIKDSNFLYDVYPGQPIRFE
ncbi:MAG: amidohydrolase family protein [Nitrososphaeraceae archaeon]